MGHVSIRRATPADADVIAGFNLAMAAETEGRRLDPDTVARGVRRVLADPAQGVYYVGERDGRVVGQLLVTFEFSDWRDGVFWWIQSVYVAPAARRQGVFRRLHAHVAGLARATPGVCGLRLYVDGENRRAQAAYERLGLRRTEYAVYETDWSPAPERTM